LVSANHGVPKTSNNEVGVLSTSDNQFCKDDGVHPATKGLCRYRGHSHPHESRREVESFFRLLLPHGRIGRPAQPDLMSQRRDEEFDPRLSTSISLKL